MALRVVVYLRKSSEDDEKQAHSIDRQRKDVREYIEKQNSIIDTPEENILWNGLENEDLVFEQHSAKLTGRLKFQKMVEKIQKKKFEVLLCTELSRLSRNPIDAGIVVSLLDIYNPTDAFKKTYLKQIRTLDKKFTTIPTDKFTLGLFLGIAKYENDIRASNTASGKRYQAEEKGRTTHLASIGYINMVDEKGEPYIAKDERNFDICRELWEMLISGEYSLKQIYQKAKNEGVQTYKGKKKGFEKPANSTIRNMFNSQYYIGKVSTKDKKGNDVWHSGEHPAMITQEEFEQAQVVLKSIGRKHAKIEKTIDIFDVVKCLGISGIYKDADGSPSKMIFTDRMRYTCTRCGKTYYNKDVCHHCNERRTNKTHGLREQKFVHVIREGKKKKNSTDISKLLPSLEEQLSQLYISDRLFEYLKKELYTLWEKQNKSYIRERNKLHKERDKLEKERQDIEAEIMSGNKVQGELARESVKRRQEEIKDRLDEIEEGYEDVFEQAWQAILVLKDAKHILSSDKIGFEHRKELLLSLSSNIVFYENRVEIKWRKPFELLVKSNVSNYKKGDKNKVYLHSFPSGSHYWMNFEQLITTISWSYIRNVEYKILDSQLKR